MKAISLYQPWASAVANGSKRIETRSWRTWYTGPIAICAAKKKSPELVEKFEIFLEQFPTIYRAFTKDQQFGFDDLPLGCVIATATLTDCVPTKMIRGLSKVEFTLGDFSPGRFGWILEDVKRLAKPIPCHGHQRIFNVDI
jgi:hypothetical protein